MNSSMVIVLTNTRPLVFDDAAVGLSKEPFIAGIAQLNRKTLRWEEVSQALCVVKKKARPEHDLAFWAKISPN